MSRLSELADRIAADKREAESLESVLLGSRDLARDLRAAVAGVGAERATGRLAAVADLLGAAQNSRWLTVGHLEDALLVIKGAMTGSYSAAGGLVLRTHPDGGRVLLGRHQDVEVSLLVALEYRPRVARLRERLGMPAAPPAELDTSGDDGLPKLQQVTRKLIRGGADVHAQFKDTANTSLAMGLERHGDDTPPTTGEAVAAVAILSVAALDGVARVTRHWKRRAT
ncbi:hypothetical protein SAMN05216298_0561 [Glycomyces sambucus]|uniref:Uncharacterized protein n=1 Tax=Glycomyces sambucus TaxID=380244 RepID=A0A1G9CY67_9ACTN|nr:hypothetical protein [Glycomyces sambucus]SDK56345.1 hypothetical protein SAMN05216298_0561 [Glycomyces sambucus]